MRPLAERALQCVEADLQPATQNRHILSVLRAAVRSDSVWQLRFVLFVGLNLTDSLPTWLYQHSPHERRQLLHFIEVLQRSMLKVLRGTSATTEGGHPEFASPQEFCDIMVRYYLKL